MIDSQNSLTVVIPAYNEAESLKLWLPHVLQTCSEQSWYLVIVNDGSKDATKDILEQFQSYPFFTILHHKVNAGYGRALKTGLAHADTHYVVTIDADGQHKLEDVQRMLEAVQSTDADMIIGSRQGQKSSSRFREVGKYIIRKFAGFLLPLHIYDLNSGFKLYNTSLVQQYLSLCPDSMAFSDIITLIFISQKHLVIELPIQVQPRWAGKSTISYQTAIETLLEIMNIIMLFNPMRIFLPLSIFTILAGILWAIPFLISGEGLTSAAMLAIMTGIIFFFLGLISEQLATLRRANLHQSLHGRSQNGEGK